MIPATGGKLTMRERVEAVLLGRRPDRLPFIDRLEVWHRSHLRAGTLPARFAGRSLTEIHRDVGIGRQKFVVPYRLRLRGVEVIARRDGEVVFHESDPVLDSFPGMWDVVATDRPGITVTELRTAAGRLSIRHEVLPDTVAMGADPYLREHLIKDAADYRTVEAVLSRAEFVPQFDLVREEQECVGDAGFVVPLVHRIPFQQVLLEYLGEVSLFFALHDDPAPVERLLACLDEQLTEILSRLADFSGIYVEFPDNLHGGMTNPRLFARYCLPHLQKYTELLHRQGKKAGSHTDGDLKSLLGLLGESGLDVCESFSPSPLTSCTFDEAWDAWQGGPLIWGGIPSPILEPRTSEADFRAHVNHLLQRVAGRPIILGVGDMVMGNNEIERVRYIAERVESHALTPMTAGAQA